MTVKAFQKKIYDYYDTHARTLPWRTTSNPYRILVSEVMLQQTQIPRVIPKYKSFLKAFPTVEALANASTAEVLVLWQGLGYNRRALSLKRAAEVIAKDRAGKFPKVYEELLELPGIGPYTASAIMSFAYNKPSIMIETNIRAVFIHFFFPGSKKVADAELVPLIKKYADNENSREWYNALMDYGSMLKATLPNPSRKSAHHVKQSTFEGSIRQVRGAIIRMYTQDKEINFQKLSRRLSYKREIMKSQYRKLKEEGFFK